MDLKLNETFNIEFQCYDPIVTQTQYDTKSEFFGSPGQQHYRLLSHLSTLFHHTTIIDIGTHRGSSALALSYNTTNTIHSFDIVDHVENVLIKQKSNIQFIIDNLFDKLDHYKTLLLSSPLIFLDIDPHDGYLEYQLYKWLKTNQYDGLLLCDDIWHFEGMRNHFWYKIEEQYKYDLTDVGHFSGTGLITFKPVDINKYNKNYINKYSNNNWTLVTAYYNLTKCPDASQEIKARDQSYYISHSYSTLSLPYHMIIYCDNESYALIKQIRPDYLDDKTKYIIGEFDDIVFNGTTFREYRDMINENRKMTPVSDPRNTASYYLFCLSRYIMLKETIETNPFESTHFAWINFCIQRMGIQNVRRLPEALADYRDPFSTVYIDYLPKEFVDNNKEYWQFGRCTMCSGFFTGRYDYMEKVCTLILEKFLYYLGLGFGWADEQLYSPVYFENKHLFKHYYGDYQQMITNYKYVYDEPEKIVSIFIKNSFIYKDTGKCLEACEYLINSLKLKKCTLNDYYLQLLGYFYLKSLVK